VAKIPAEPSSRPYRIILAEEQTLVRHGMALVLSSEPDLEVIADAADGLEVLQLAEQLQPDVIILDVLLPKLNGPETTKRLARISPASRVLGLSGYSDPIYIREIMRAGALGCLLKEQDQTEFIEAVRSVAKGKPYLSPKISGWVRDNGRRGDNSTRINLLTLRELEVLKLLAQGKTNKEVAAILDRSLYTVDAHRGRIMEKLDLHSTGEIVRFALRHGLID
jgi:two-component system, NarL family, response regulator NreC